MLQAVSSLSAHAAVGSSCASLQMHLKPALDVAGFQKCNCRADIREA